MDQKGSLDKLSTERIKS